MIIEDEDLNMTRTQERHVLQSTQVIWLASPDIVIVLEPAGGS
jgi:hypothetical protein